MDWTSEVKRIFAEGLVEGGVAGAPLTARKLDVAARSMPRLTAEGARAVAGLWSGAATGDILLPTYGATGEVVGARLWTAAGVRLAPPASSGLATTGAALMTPALSAWLRGEGERPGEVWIAEGEPDWLSAMVAAYLSGGVAEVVGIYSGAWSQELGARLGEVGRVGILTDRDKAGARYAETVRATLGAEVVCWRWGWGGGDVNDHWRAHEDPDALAEACGRGPAMPPAPTADEGRWAWSDEGGGEWVEDGRWLERRAKEVAWAAAQASAPSAQLGDAHLERARKWARAALERSVRDLASAQGDRHGALRIMAPVASMVAGGALSGLEVRQAWTDAYVAAGEDRETRLDRARMVKDALSYPKRTPETLEDIARALAARDEADKGGKRSAAAPKPKGEEVKGGQRVEVAGAAAEAPDLSWQDDLPRKKGGAPNLDARWVRAILTHDARFGRVRYDKLQQAIRVYGSPSWVCGAPDGALFEDAHIDLLRCEIAGTYGATTPPADAVMSGLRAAAATSAFDPLSDYLRGLAWDGTPRLATWLVDYCHIDSPEMARVVGPRWMIGAVARGLQPGAKMDNSLILEGIQGVKKSSAAEALVPWESLFLPFASDPGSKDALENMQGAWIVELAEMAMLSRGRDMRTIKDFISRRTDRYRAAYGYVSADRPRRCVFFGTINPEGAGDYLADSTGNRRWWPVRVTAPVDVDRLRADRDQLWAEAVARFDAGEAWHIEPGSEEEAVVAVEAGKRAGLDEWASILEPWMSSREGRPVTIAEVMQDALEFEARQMDRAAQMRVAVALRQLGWEPHKGARGSRTWHKPSA